MHMKKICDLHTHSTYSDGTCIPVELLDLAEATGLSAVALTDHNTVAGLPEFLEAAKGREVEPVPGVEFSTDYQGTELHILGLYIHETHYAAVTKKMEEMLRAKEISNRKLIENLNMTGLRLDYDKIKTQTPGGQVNRAVIGAEIARLGYADSVKDAFGKYLSVKCGFYQPPQRPDALEMIRYMKSIGAVAVLAHPFLNLKTEEKLREFLSKAVEAGLDGMEVLYPLFDEKTTALAVQLAKEFDLLPSGGSDFHGTNKPDIQIATGKGNLSVPYGFLEGLQEKISSRKTEKY